MKFTLGWLKTHLDTPATATEVAARLNAIGFEVDGIDHPGARLAGFRVARVLAADPHPQADKLQVLSVDAGDGPVQVVCGAPNARAGLVGVFGAPGAVVPASGMVLRIAAIRGVESHGMLCSSRELELGDEHDGIIELPADAPVGIDYARYAERDDPVFDVSVTPNRQDCMGVRGIARDLAAAGLGTLRPLIAVYPCAIEPVVGESAAPDVRTDDPEGCPAFYARTIAGVRNGPAPAWLTQRLRAVGQRSISALVDITNFVMLDLGRPSHAYDRAKLSGTVVARRAIAGETVIALDGKSYTLTPDMTVIADAREVHDIAGIKGGEHSGIADATTDVLLEVAYFTPERIARTGQALNLTSDARTRFERGVDPAALDSGLDVLTGLILAHCGGVASTIVRAGSPPLATRTIAYRPALTMALGGIAVPDADQQAILTRLGFTVQVADEGWCVTIPTWRRDVDGAADLVEEIVRIVGLDQIVSVPLPRADGVARPTATPLQKLERRVRRIAAARGLNEAITWSFIGEPEAATVGGGSFMLANPIADTLKIMRPSLLPGLLAAARRNIDRGADSVRLFEIGRRYLAEGEPLTAGVVLAGDQSARHWASGKATGFDAYDAKAEALALLAAAGAPTDNLQVFDAAGAPYHPGQSGTLRLGAKTVLAAFGALHPATAKAFDLPAGVVACEIYLDAVTVKRSTGFARPPFAPPALQVVRRDFALLVPAALSADALVRAVRGADKAAIAGVKVFDVFAGAGVPAGQTSIGLEVVLQPVVRSFTDDEIAGIAARIVAAAAKVGATLRG